MNTQEFIDKNLRLALGNMHVELILAQSRIAELEERLASKDAASKELELGIPVPPQPKANGAPRKEG